ncbi:MAG TPA: hypothetical protein VKG43_04405 [Acidimicrobiales bacterium]|nr:hypothetical protein [Acidimicrobiales bacterium]
MTTGTEHERLTVLCGASAPDAPVPGTLVATTPLSLDAAQRRGLRATVLDDHFDRRLELPDDVAYARWKLSWMRRLDEVAVDGRGSAFVSLWYLSYPLDTLIGRTILFRALVDALGPEVISVHCDQLAPDSVDATGLIGGDLLFRPLSHDLPIAVGALRAIGEASRIPVEVREVETPDGTGGARVTGLSGLELAARRRLRPLVRRARTARLGWSGRGQAGERGPVGTVMMTWDAGYGHDEALRRLLAAGYGVAELDRGPVVALRRLGHRPLVRIDPAAWASPPDGPLSADLLDLLDEIDRWTKVPGSGRLLSDKLARFVGGVCPAVEGTASRLAPAMVDAGVDQVLSANPCSIAEFAALVAARRLGGITTVLAQHGDDAFDFANSCLMEQYNFDRVLVSDPSRLADGRRYFAEIGLTPPEFRLASPRVDELRRRPPRAHRAATDGRPTVCYLPLMFVGDFMYLGCGLFDDAWYLRWQWQLLELFSARPDYRFVWKILPGQVSPPDPIATELRRSPPANVEVSERPFLRVAPEVDRFISDFPSTGTFEAAHLGIPLLSVVFERFGAIRDRAAELFGQSMRRCGTEAEALTAVDQFLSAPAAAWTVNPPWAPDPWP